MIEIGRTATEKSRKFQSKRAFLRELQADRGTWAVRLASATLARTEMHRLSTTHVRGPRDLNSRRGNHGGAEGSRKILDKVIDGIN